MSTFYRLCQYMSSWLSYLFLYGTCCHHIVLSYYILSIFFLQDERAIQWFSVGFIHSVYTVSNVEGVYWMNEAILSLYSSIKQKGLDNAFTHQLARVLPAIGLFLLWESGRKKPLSNQHHSLQSCYNRILTLHWLPIYYCKPYCHLTLLSSLFFSSSFMSSENLYILHPNQSLCQYSDLLSPQGFPWSHHFSPVPSNVSWHFLIPYQTLKNFTSPFYVLLPDIATKNYIFNHVQFNKNTILLFVLHQYSPPFI